MKFDLPPAAPAQSATATPVAQPMQVTNAPTNIVPVSVDDIAEVGQTSMTKLSTVTDQVTQQARGADLDEMGKLLGNLLVTAKGYDPTNLAKGGGLFGMFKSKVQQIQNNFTSVDTQVDQLLGQIDSRIAHFKARIPVLKKMREDTIQFHADLGTEMARFEERIAWMEANPPAIDPNDAFSSSAAANWQRVIEMGRKRVDDLRRVQFLAQQAVPTIDNMSVNCSSLVQKFTDVKATTIPAWKQLFAQYIIQLEIKKGAEMAKSIEDAFNEALIKGSELNKQNTISVQTSLNRSVVDMSTLQTTQKNLMDSIDAIHKIAEEGRQRRAAERPQLEALSKELNEKLSQRR